MCYGALKSNIDQGLMCYETLKSNIDQGLPFDLFSGGQDPGKILAKRFLRPLQ
jgi:hypothetical protein